MKTYKLYAIFNTINNKLYIGFSCNIKRRWCEHKKKGRQVINKRGDKTCHAIHYALAKYGIDKFVFKELEDLPDLESANAREIEIIKIAKENNFQLYNETDGGDGGLGVSVPWADERKKIFSEQMKGAGNPMYGVQLFGPANGNYGKKMKPHVKKELLKHRCKLNQEQVEEIKQLYSTGKHTQTSLSKQFGISLTQIHRIVNGHRWLKEGDVPPKIKPNLKPEQVKEMRELYSSGDYTHVQLGDIYGISDAQVSRIIRRIKWKDI